MSEERGIAAKLDEIIERLECIEARQIRTTAMVSEDKEHERPLMGGFEVKE